MQVPIFIYSLFNQMCVDLYKFKTVILENKNLINHRSTSQVLSECCIALVKCLVDTLASKLKDSYSGENEASVSLSLSSS